MKAVILIMISISLFAINRVDIIDNSEVIKNGWSKKTVCKNGYLVVVVKGDNFEIEYPVCTTFSGWNNECTHLPVKCSKKD